MDPNDPNQASSSATTYKNGILLAVFILIVFTVLGTFISAVLLFDSAGHNGELPPAYKGAAWGLGAYNLVMCLALLGTSVYAYVHQAKIKAKVSQTLYNLQKGGPSVVMHHSQVNNSEIESQHKEPYQQVNYPPAPANNNNNNPASGSGSNSNNSNNSGGGNIEDVDLFM